MTPPTCSLLLLFNRPGFFFFFIGLVDASCGEWPLEECGGLGNFLFCAVRSAEPGSRTDTNNMAEGCTDGKHANKLTVCHSHSRTSLLIFESVILLS